jgi:hypothetical protein
MECFFDLVEVFFLGYSMSSKDRDIFYTIFIPIHTYTLVIFSTIQHYTILHKTTLYQYYNTKTLLSYLTKQLLS